VAQAEEHRQEQVRRLKRVPHLQRARRMGAAQDAARSPATRSGPSLWNARQASSSPDLPPSGEASRLKWWRCLVPSTAWTQGKGTSAHFRFGPWNGLLRSRPDLRERRGRAGVRAPAGGACQ
jgi:hypothetical protein